MKKFLLVVVAALLIMASGILLLVWWVSLEDYREVIEARVERATGYPLTIGGEMSLTLWPRLGIVLEETELGNPPGFPAGEPLLKIRSLRVSIPVAPLFEHRLVLEDAVMEGVEAHLVRNREGVGNWEALIAGGGKPDHPPAGQRGAGSDLSDRLEMDVAAIELRDARLTFRDRQAGTFREIAGVDLRLSELDPEHGGRLTLEAGVRLEEGAAEVPLAVEAVMGWNLQEGRFRLEPLRLSLGDLRLSGRLESEQQEGQPRYRIRMASEPFRPIDLLRDLLPETEGLPKGVLGRESRLSLQVDGTPKALRIETLELNSGDLTVRGRLEVAGLESGEPHFSGKLKGAPFDLRRLLAEAGLHLDDILSPGRLTRASLSMRMKGDMEHLEFPALLFRFDDSILRGEAAFRFREGQLPATSFRLGLDNLDLDAYLLPRKPAGAAGEATGGKAAAPLLPVESLRNLALDGRLFVKKLSWSGLDIEKARMIVGADEGLLKIQPVGMWVAGGKLHLKGEMDVTGDTPRMKGTLTAEEVQIGPLLEAFADFDRLQGQADVRAHFATSGNTVDELVAALAGRGTLRMVDGSVRGFNIPQMLREAEAKLAGRTDLATGPQKTDFSELGATWKIRNGVVTNDDLLAKSPLLRVTGAGKADLPRERIDYLLKVVVVSTLEGQGGAGLDRLVGLPVPLRIEGPLDAPRMKLDLEAALTEKQRQKLEKKKGELKQKLERKLESKLGADGEKAPLDEKEKELKARLKKEERKMKEKLEKLLGR